MNNYIKIGERLIGCDFKPFVIAEIGINHEGSFEKASRMIEDAYQAGCECVKLQTHIPEEEMIYNSVIPANATESIWDMMKRCALTATEEAALKWLVESKGMIFLSTPFSRAAADRLDALDIPAFKIGSGECNNYPLVEHVAKFGKPIILSTGMNDINSISKSVEILKKYNVPYALLQCTSMYPTPYEKVRLGGIKDLKEHFPDTVVGLSDHSVGNYTCFGAIALGAAIVEKHFTSDRNWPGPDIPISITPNELKDLIKGASAIHQASNGIKDILVEEESTIKFAYSSIVSIGDILKGQLFSKNNIWVKRPGTGEIRAEYLKDILGKKALVDIKKNQQIQWDQIDD